MTDGSDLFSRTIVSTIAKLDGPGVTTCTTSLQHDLDTGATSISVRDHERTRYYLVGPEITLCAFLRELFNLPAYDPQDRAPAHQRELP